MEPESRCVSDCSSVTFIPRLSVFLHCHSFTLSLLLSLVQASKISRSNDRHSDLRLSLVAASTCTYSGADLKSGLLITRTSLQHLSSLKNSGQ